MKISDYNQLSKDDRKKVKFKEAPVALKVIYICIILLLVVGIGTCVNSMTNNQADSKNGIDTLALQLTAKSVAEQQVKALLKSPASASFPDDAQNYWIQADSTIVIKGAVDAQNAFGAMLRTPFYVKLKWSADYKNFDNWSVLESYLDE